MLFKERESMYLVRATGMFPRYNFSSILISAWWRKEDQMLKQGNIKTCVLNKLSHQVQSVSMVDRGWWWLCRLIALHFPFHCDDATGICSRAEGSLVVANVGGSAGLLPKKR